VNADIETIGKEIKALRDEERKLNDDILRGDRAFEDKWKLLNEM